MEAAKPSPAFLSIRLPEATRDRLKAAAAARGETLQGLVEHLVEEFLAKKDSRPPDLATVMSALRGHSANLRARGITHLWVFGSVARGEANPESDVDLLAEFDPARRLSLVGLSSLRAELSDMLGAAADLVERDVLRPLVRQAAEREAIQVW